MAPPGPRGAGRGGGPGGAPAPASVVLEPDAAGLGAPPAPGGEAPEVAVAPPAGAGAGAAAAAAGLRGRLGGLAAALARGGGGGGRGRARAAVGADAGDAELLRFLVARRWDEDLALRQYLEYREFRLEYPVGAVTACMVRASLGHDKSFALPSADRRGNCVVVMLGRRHFPGDVSDAECFLYPVFCFDRVVAHAERLGGSKVTAVLDLSDVTVANLDLRQAKEILRLAQDRFPERLGCAILLNAPRIFFGLWKAIQPFLDERTKDKFKFAYGPSELQEELQGTRAGGARDVPEILGGSFPDAELLRIPDLPLPPETGPEPRPPLAAAAGGPRRAVRAPAGGRLPPPPH